MSSKPDQEAEVLAIARAAGLDKAIAQFRNDVLVETVAAALRSSGLPPQFLELELTESLLVDDTAEAMAMMMRLKEVGVAISIDDFGIGFSSFGYLKEFPIDLLKIDRSFIRDLANSPRTPLSSRRFRHWRAA